MEKLPPLPKGIRTLSDPESKRLNEEHPGIPLSPRSGCVTCSTKGSFRWWNEDRTEIVEYECNCDDQWLAHRYFLSRGIGLNYQRLGWMDAQAADPGAMTKIVDWIANAESNFRIGRGLYLWSASTGTGKTMLSVLLLKRMLADGHDGFFTTFQEMLDTFTGGWHDAEKRRWFHRRISNAGLLVIDDPGKEMKGRVALPEAMLDEVIRHRVSDSLPTIIDTNYDLAKFQEAYGQYVMSLLRESCTTYEFKGADFRDELRKRDDEEVALDLRRPIVVG